ncbi:hypothetical protein L0Y40_01440 [Candidatus Wolfebacteria bacterium]|nr:hypothetical protein [Candidatus Wolfebacteria bacterium]
MAGETPTSFIPKKTTGRQPRSSPLSFLSLTASIVFVVALLGAGGVFLYGRFLEGSIIRKQDSLEQAREAFEPALIEELARLDTRMASAELLLGSHRALSNFFTVLEGLTLQNVRFSNFGYSEGTTGDFITMEGEARSFNAVALQADVLSKSPYFHDVIFGDLAVNERGGVNFGVSATLDPSLLVYAPRASAPPELPEENVSEAADTAEALSETPTP